METDEPRSFNPKSIRIFISHSSKDVTYATQIKMVLENYFGFEVFVAHEDLEPTSIWADRILEELASTDILIALFTENFKSSDYADQECGNAIANNKFIIPIRVTINPYGFLSKYQALAFKLATESVDSWIFFCRKIVTIIRDNPQFADKVTDLQIQALKNSHSFDTTKKIIHNLPEMKTLSPDQMNEIVRAYCSNGQVAGEGFTVPYYMDALMKDFKHQIDENLILAYETA